MYSLTHFNDQVIMKILLVQPATIWESKQANFEKIEGLVNDSFGKVDLVVLPEMFTTGFTLKAETFAEAPDGETSLWMKELAKKGNFAVCGSMITKSGDQFYNYEYYKRHLFSMAGENLVFTPGNSRTIINYKGFRILPIICYDLRFPVWSRNKGDYDIMICVANWPDVRRVAWTMLLRARAIENQCYVVGANRVGCDNEGLCYAGDSVLLDPVGKSLARVNDYEEGAVIAEISISELKDIREKFPVWNDADDFEIKI
jgi:omega-amidase